MKKTHIRSDYKGISLYNTEKQELIGVFSSISLVERYIYDQYSSVKNNVYTALMKKTRIRTNKLGIVLCVRVATERQVELLEGEDYYVFPQYPQTVTTRMKGYTSGKEELRKKAADLMNKIAIENKRKNGTK
jgi:hypothetical protein